MGKKYSINSAGRIVAERDIYSLGGFIPKGRLGGAIKDETQLSQEGECWIAGGDISTRPDVIVKDNAYIGDFFTNENPVHTDGSMVFSGNTLIPGYITIRCPQADPKNNVFVKDSFIGVSMDVLFGVSSKCHPVEQGQYNKDAPKGTLFTSSSMKLDAANCVRNTATIRLSKYTYLYTPAGYNARVFWAYYDASNQLAFSGETLAVSQALTKLDHPVYKLCMVFFAKSPTLTPAELEASGAKILGHISGSLLMDLRPESVSGEYVMDNSSFIMPTSNFGLNTTQLRFLAGGLHNTNMYTPTDRQDYKPYGTFRNVERVEYSQYFADIHRGNVNRDRYIMASDSPLIRIGGSFVSGSLVNAGGLTLRRCIVPLAIFKNDVIDGNTYEDIDFSYATEFLGNTEVPNRTLVSSHKQGLYNMWANSDVLLGRVSYPGNAKDATGLTENHETIMLDGNMIESGTYAGDPGKTYEANKIPATNRVRMIRPVSTRGAVFPNIPAGYSVRAVHYLDESFILRKAVENPSTMESEFPFYVMSFQKTDPNANLPASEFVSKNAYLNVNEYTKVPEITGSAYLGAGVIVRGDVQLIGDPYVNRVFDMNVWERGTTQDGDLPNYPTWDDRKIPTSVGNRFRFVDAFEVEPGGTFTCANGYLIHLYRFDDSGKWIGQAGWATSQYIPEGNTRFAGLIIKKATSASDAGSLITEDDIPLANVKYLRAFKKIRYITNELDRKSPEDILLTPDYWEQGSMSSGEANAGKTYEELKTTYTKAIRLKRPVNVYMPGQSTGQGTGFNVSRQVFDALTKLYAPVSDDVYARTALITLVTVKSNASDVLPSESPNSRVYVEFTPSPRIIVPYGSNTLTVNGVKIRMYDNAVLSRNLNQEGTIILQGSAVMGYDFNSGACLCSNGHDDAIIKLP